MADAPKQSTDSSLLVDEYFAAEDDRFLDALSKLSNPKATAALADRWKRDPRPWARQQLLAYLQRPLNTPGHQPLVRRLFKQAEELRDDELMAAFLVAFDRLVRRERKMRWRWDWQTRQSWQEETLHSPQNEVPKGLSPRKFRNRFTGAQLDYDPRVPKNGRLYSYRSRYYLRRRAWRYFRHLGYSRSDQYVQGIAAALTKYTDDDLSRGEHLLECWGLVHACFWRHPALKFGATRVQLAAGRNLGELSPVPRFLSLWQGSDAAGVLLDLAAAAKSRLVRKWAMDLFEHHHITSLANVGIGQIVELLGSELTDVQEFGAKLFENSSQLPTLSTSQWLALLKTDNPNVLAMICDAMVRHIQPNQLELKQIVHLACVKSTPVARLGFDMLQRRGLEGCNADEMGLTFQRLADAQCPAVAAEMTTWALGLLGSREKYDLEQVNRFFDSLLEETRQAAWTWLIETPHAYEDAALFARLLETPFEDLRLRLIDDLQNRSQSVASQGDRLTPLWTSVLFSVTRGGRQKPKALSQLTDAVITDPAKAEKLLPVLAVAVRSVRQPELRSGLAAVARLIRERPELTSTIERQLPELDFIN